MGYLRFGPLRAWWSERLQTMQVWSLGHSGDEQSLYQVQGSQIWLRGMAGWDATEGVVTSVAGFSIVEGVACRRVKGVKKGYFRCSKLSPHFTSPNSMDPRTL